MMKKVMIRLCAVACIGLAVTACGGHKDNDANTVTPEPQTVIDTMGANHPEEKEEHKATPANSEKTEEHKEHKHSETKEANVPVEKGAPKVDTADAVKPKAESTVGGATKHHVKPGGLQGGK